MKVLWSIDTRDPNIDSRVEAMGRVLSNLASSGLSLCVQPVTLLTPDLVRVSTQLDVEQLEVDRDAADVALRSIQRPSGAIDWIEPEVLVRIETSGGNPYQLLTQFADESSFQFILTSPHINFGFSRMVSGSFTEILVEHSPIPVLAVPDRPYVGKRWNDEFLIATDLSQQSRKTVHYSVDLAAALGSDATLVHSNKKSGTASESLTEPLKAWKDWFARHGKKVEIIHHARNAGVSLGEALMEAAAQRGSRFLVLTNHSTEAPLQEDRRSLTRRLLHESEIPLWILRADMKLESSSACPDSAKSTSSE